MSGKTTEKGDKGTPGESNPHFRINIQMLFPSIYFHSFTVVKLKKSNRLNLGLSPVITIIPEREGEEGIATQEKVLCEPHKER